MRRILAFITAAIMLAVAGCGSQSGQGGGDGGTIKIAALFPLSGPNALLGDESFRGVQLAVEQRNEQGGINGKKIELVKADAPDANAAQAEANRLITQEGIKVIVGSYSSAISTAASEVAERNGVLYWETGAVSDSITQRGYRYVVRTNATGSQIAKAQVDFIADVVTKKLGKAPGDLRVVVAHEDSQYGTTVAQAFQNYAKEKHLNVVLVQPYSATSVDLSSVVLNIKKTNPDVVAAVSYLNDAILFWRQAKELGLNVSAMIGGGGGHSMGGFYSALGKDADGVLDADFPQYEMNRQGAPELDNFVRAYKARYNQDPRSGHSLTTFVGTNALLDIIAKVGAVDPDKIRDAIASYKVDIGKLPNGWGMDFDPTTGQNKASRIYIHQWQDGKLVTVWPQDVAMREATVPLPKWGERK